MKNYLPSWAAKFSQLGRKNWEAGYRNGLVVFFYRILMPLAYFFCQLGRFQHFQPGTPWHELTLEIGCGSHEELEVGIVLFRCSRMWRQFLLGVMQGKVAQVVHLFTISTQNDSFGQGSVTNHNAIALAEEVVGIERVSIKSWTSRWEPLPSWTIFVTSRKWSSTLIPNVLQDSIARPIATTKFSQRE